MSFFGEIWLYYNKTRVYFDEAYSFCLLICVTDFCLLLLSMYIAALCNCCLETILAKLVCWSLGCQLWYLQHVGMRDTAVYCWRIGRNLQMCCCHKSWYRSCWLNSLSLSERGMCWWVGDVTLATITGTSILVPYLCVKLQRLIWRLGTRRLHLRVLDPQMSCRDFTSW